MATELLARPADSPMMDLRPKRTWRSAKSAIYTVAMFLCFVAVLVPLFFVVLTVVQKGIAIISWEFFTDDIPVQGRSVGGGMGPAIVGTLLITAMASLIAIPLGILGAVYLNEYSANGRLGRLVRFMANVMTGVPSIVMGLFVYVIWTLRFGFSGLGGAIALACLMLPIVIRSSEEMLRLVPNYLREASYALGTSKSRTVLTIVLPAAMPGVVSGCLLAVARAAGETAPLLFTVGLITSTNVNVLDGANTTLSLQIFRNATSPFEGANDRAWGAALVLIVLTFVLTILARLVTARFAQKQ